MFEVKKNPQIIWSGEYNIVDSVFHCLFVNQLKHVFHPALLYVMVSLQLPVNKVFFFYIFYCAAMGAANVIQLAKNKELSSSLLLTFHVNLLKYLSLGVSLFFIWLYYCQVLHYSILLCVLLGNIAVMLVRMVLATMPRTYVDGQFGDLMEGVQIFFIALKMLGFISFSWTWVLVFYTIFTYLFMLAGMMTTVFLPLMLGMSTFHPPDSEQRKTIRFSCWIFFHMSWKGLWFYYLFQNFFIFVSKDGLAPGTLLWETDPTLLPLCVAFCVGGVINFLWFHQQKHFLSRIIALKLMIIITSKGVRREIIDVPFDMKIVKAGTNYFKKLLSTRKLPETIELPEMAPPNDLEVSECMICCSRPSEVLIRPCNHGGICERCIITYLGTSNTCPNCKTLIKKIYVMDYNKDVKKFYGTKVLTLV